MKDYFGWRTREADNAEMIDELVCRKNGLELMKREKGQAGGHGGQAGRKLGRRNP